MHVLKLNTPCERELRSVIDTLPVMIALVGPCRHYRIINRAYYEYFGSSEQELIGRHASEVLGEPYYSIVERYMDHALQGKSTTWLTTHSQRGRDERMLSVRLLPHRSSHDDDCGILFVAEDVTEMMSLKQRFAILNEKLDQRVNSRTQELERELERSRNLASQLRKLAERDPLTGLLNRRTFDDRLLDSLQLMRANGGVLAYMLIDIDHFKSINDRFGHMAGDAVLNEFASKLASQFRGTDHVGRIGGEEFAIAMPGTSADAARRIADQLREVISRTPVIYNGESVSMTISVGVTQVSPGGNEARHAYQRADRALYDAKNGGRNRVCVVL